MKTLIAIDPGKSGGIAIKHGNQQPYVYPMPDTEGDIVEIINAIAMQSCAEGMEMECTIEDQCGYTGGKCSGAAMFTFGEGFGFILGLLMGLRIKIRKVRPVKWQAALSLGHRDKDKAKTVWKNKLKARAQELFPNIKVTLETADALLLLEYAEQQEKMGVV